MPWTTKRRLECYPAAETNVMPMRSRARLLLIVLIAVLSIFSEIHASRADTNEIRQPDAAWIPITDGSAQPTDAWSEFCERSPGECAINPAEPATINLDERVWNAIVAINKHVNAAVSPQEDIDHWGVIDRWDYPDDGYGDCEDYQILKRRLLVEAGLPRRALRMVVVLDELGAGHAVMAVRTEQGDFILDNKRDAVLPWHQTGYVYIKSEGDTSLAWVSLRNQVVVTSAVSP
jgi:predicted transglutaminase-like cysteine proteinase